MREKTCKVYTPWEVVRHILDKIGYTTDLYGKKVLENSCGTGNFLVEIVSRYISDGLRHGKNAAEIKIGLEHDIHGIEKDEEICQICLSRLDALAAEHGITDVRWHIDNTDALKAELRGEYQFVVGNPPYITYYNMELEDRKWIREQFAVCQKGKPDYYYAFTEAAIKALAPDGIMAYLIPNNFMKNRYSEALRTYMLPYLQEIEDYKFERLFEKRQTSSAIVVCTKRNQQEFFTYREHDKGTCVDVHKPTLAGKWLLDSTLEIAAGNVHSERCFKDWFRVLAPVATLLNDAYVIREFHEGDAWIETEGYCLERECIRPASSPKSRQCGETNYIVFPYYYENGECHRYSEEEFKKKFPQTTAYLEQYRSRLQERKADARSQWFEYGRSQALRHLNQEKIMMSTLVTGTVRYYRLGSEEVPYSGMFIVPQGNHVLDEAEAILNSREFLTYIQRIGIHANGKTYRVSPNDVANYRF